MNSPQDSWVGADALADRLKIYWARRGFQVTTEVVPIPNRRGSFFTIRSNLVNGMPPNAKVMGAFVGPTD
jgi:hypothetical protein